MPETPEPQQIIMMKRLVELALDQFGIALIVVLKVFTG